MLVCYPPHGSRALGDPLTGHPAGDGAVGPSVAFTPDGKTLATGSQDGTVILWDLTDRTAGEGVAELAGAAAVGEIP
jgi:WD40 repeat protein